MADYKIVKKCRLCEKRFVVGKDKARYIYCEACQQRIQDGRKKEEEEEQEKESAKKP